MKYSTLILTIMLFSFISSKIILKFQNPYIPEGLKITLLNTDTDSFDFKPKGIKQLEKVLTEFSEPFEMQCIHFKEKGNIMYKLDFSDKKGKCPEGYGKVKDVSIKFKPESFRLCCYNNFDKYVVEGDIPMKSKLFLKTSNKTRS
jgi:hypothetical protein